jgi:prolyl-tRNA synthetase
MDITEKFLHEQLAVPFFFFRRPEWDKFKGAVDTFGADAFMPNGIVIQLPSTHMLGQNFSIPYNVKFKTEDEKDAYVWQTCYGPCISRIFASVIAMHGDNKGLILPWSIAPTQVVIIPVLKKDSDKTEIIKHCKKLQKTLRSKGLRVEIDDSDKRPGSKYYYWELKGACLRMEIGLREMENAEITVARRDNGKKEVVKEKDLDKFLSDVPSSILKTLRERADVAFESCIHKASTMEELKKQVEKGGFTRVNFCSRDAEGEACADVVKANSGGGEVRGTLHGKEEKTTGPCIVCGKKANAVVYVAKSY